jgi:hypothetical protein
LADDSARESDGLVERGVVRDAHAQQLVDPEPEHVQRAIVDG